MIVKTDCETDGSFYSTNSAAQFITWSSIQIEAKELKRDAAKKQAEEEGEAAKVANAGLIDTICEHFNTSSVDLEDVD